MRRCGALQRYANKPLGMMHWLTYANPPVPPTATVALIDPDMFFLRPLWHDSFADPSKCLVTGPAKRTPIPSRVVKGERASLLRECMGRARVGGCTGTYGLASIFTSLACAAVVMSETVATTTLLATRCFSFFFSLEQFFY